MRVLHISIHLKKLIRRSNSFYVELRSWWWGYTYFRFRDLAYGLYFCEILPESDKHLFSRFILIKHLEQSLFLLDHLS